MKINYKLLNITLVFIIFYIVFESRGVLFSLFSFIKCFSIPFFISLLFYYLLDPFRSFLCNRFSINEKIVSGFLIFIFFALIILFLLIIVPFILKEFKNIYINYYDFLNNIDFNKYFISFFDNIFGFVDNVFNLIINIVFVIIITFFIMINRSTIKSFIFKYFGDKEINLFCFINSDIRKYIFSLEIIVLIEMIEYTLFYLLIGHPNFLFIGIISGLANIVPFVGSLFSTCISLVTSINVSVKLFILSSIGCLVIPIIDNYIIDPKIFSNGLKVSFLTILIVVFITNILFGMSGLFFSMFIYIVIKNIFKIYVKY